MLSFKALTKNPTPLIEAAYASGRTRPPKKVDFECLNRLFGDIAESAVVEGLSAKRKTLTSNFQVLVLNFQSTSSESLIKKTDFSSNLLNL